jgi:hypothetical protein
MSPVIVKSLFSYSSRSSSSSLLGTRDLQALLDLLFAGALSS